MAKNVVPQPLGTVEVVQPLSMRVHWNNEGDINGVGLVANEQDAGGSNMQTRSVSVDPSTLPPGILVALNQLVDHMLDEYFTEHDFTEQP